MQDCGRTTTLLDHLRDLGVEDLNCGAKGARILQMTLDKFFLDTIDYPGWRVTHVVTGTGQQTETTDFPIAKFVGFFGAGTCNSCLLTKEDCSSCNSCSTCDTGACIDDTKLKQVIATVSDEAEATYREGEYSVCYKTIDINIPDDMTLGYAVYVRGADELTTLTAATVAYPAEAMVALDLLIQYDAAVREHDFDVANFFAAKYTDALKSLLNKDSTIPFGVGMSTKMV